MNPLNLYEAYAAVYDEDLREEILTVEEDFEFVDDLSDNELDEIMEEIISEDITFMECINVLDEMLLSEATVTSSADRKKSGSAKVTVGHESERREAKTAERKRKVRIGRIVQSAKGAFEKVKSGAKKVARAGKAAYKAAKHELSGQREKETRAKRTGYEMRKAVRRQAAAASAKKDFEKSGKAPEGKYRNVGAGKKERAGGEQKPERKTVSEPNKDRIAAAKEKLAKAAKGSSSRGVRFATSSGKVSPTVMRSGKDSPSERTKAASRFAKKAGIGENFEAVLGVIFDDMIHEGYVSDYETAAYVVESLTEDDLYYVLESYSMVLVEEVNQDMDDLFDFMLEYLVSEGYADTNQDAIVIMANMSEGWRNEIIEGYKDFPTAKVMNKAGKLMGSSAGKTDPKSKKKEERGIKMMDTMMQHTPDR